ncbi:MAG: hypothetical protein CMJ42_12300 [Phyllobacteriaceae bacterium]|nr:hypothetical protein [Phyllobacteriaceae bacterium]MBA91711.1 hypothetical protein [Phyllobacteriaceae bacterium]
MVTQSDDRITVEPFDGVVNVRFIDAMLASTDRALVLREKGHDPVFYIPFDDIYFEMMHESQTRTQCPWKGEARYWSTGAVGEAAADVMWAYEEPHGAARPIAGHGAFYPGKVTIDVTPNDSPRRLPDQG